MPLGCLPARAGQCGEAALDLGLHLVGGAPLARDEIVAQAELVGHLVTQRAVRPLRETGDGGHHVELGGALGRGAEHVQSPRIWASLSSQR